MSVARAGIEMSRPQGLPGTASAPGRACPGPWTSFEVPADLRELAALRTALAGALSEACWETEMTGCVLLAAQEALVNAVEHGSEPGATIVLSFRIDDAEASVFVLDRGVRGVATPLRVPPPPSDRQPHGRGLLIRHALADRCLTVARESGTEVRLQFRRVSAAAAYQGPVSPGAARP